MQAPEQRNGLCPVAVAAIGKVQVALQKFVPTQSSLPDMAEWLADGGFLVTLRTGLSVGTECTDYLSILRHSYLICQEGSSGLCIIVDPAFREQFTVAGMPSTSSYAVAVSNLPECFIGTIGTVSALVSLLTGTLHKDAGAIGLELPPWRSKQALLSKWLPRRFSDSVFAPPSQAALHPALRSSVHGLRSNSPVSVNSFSSSQCCVQGGCTSSKASFGACSNASCNTSASLHSEPQTVIRGFREPSFNTIQNRSGNGSSCCTTTRSALSLQLAAATEASRSVQLQAQALWERCLLVAENGLQPQPQSQPQPQLQPQRQPPPLQPLPVIAAGPHPCHSGGSQQSQQTLLSHPKPELQPAAPCFDVQDSAPDQASGTAQQGDGLVVSSAFKRSNSAASLKLRGNGNSLKLQSTTRKMLPRIHTVKLAAVAAC
ncbi:hypothetical protein Agub_g13716 [Astrephomene gubernaculifera]|uniref:Uncharacterized protein n=1 Tax=Astrephomene gubernaculifera TaxID=47775 RepID=A0AAD3HSN5_9CHLO|nr:hypothetical protein Agub_g13716 [Astrephomene gubernaculifera]